MPNKKNGKNVATMPRVARTPAGRYLVRVEDAALMQAPNGEVGLIWVLHVYIPPQHEGVSLAKATPLDLSHPSTMLEAADELGRCGLATRDIYEGDVPALLRGLHLEIDYTPESADSKGAKDGASGQSEPERIEIVGRAQE